MGIEKTLSQVRAGLLRLQPAQAYAASHDDDTFVVDTRPGFRRRDAGEIPGALVIERNHLEWRLDPTIDVGSPKPSARTSAGSWRVKVATPPAWPLTRSAGSASVAVPM